MRYEYKFAKILSIKEREKDSAQAVYQESVRKFEESAERLYELLKKKETLAESQFFRLQQGLPVMEIRHQQQFISNLEKTIDHYQKMVMNARNRMNYQQEQLMEKNIEVRKYEKIQEKDQTRYLAEEKLIDNRLMDDISIQQYMSRES
ncbi:flagellar export protein FliJ [Mesobacillus harenae]|uniref:flagellar export protein FliJ n=1 Tax=Mesobacillus harenae TaxID=2213203 RepID=UPI0015804DAB|nr:flagellar export protein FliJ [Mesobacillus harenae]